MKDIIWYEKYRAKDLDGLILSKNIKHNMTQYIENTEIPHLLLHGPVGSGKTTIAFILIKHCASAKLILNASSTDRGIDTIKKKVKQFAASKHIGDKLNIVLFDEADGLTPDAQFALKNTIENYKSNCRFIFTANNLDRIVDAIYSRCTAFAFDAMPQNYFLDFIYNILDKEKIKYKQKDIEYLVERYGTDVRTVLNNLQAGSVSGKFKLRDILDIFNTQNLLKLIENGQITKIRKKWAGQTDFIWFYKFIFNYYTSQKKSVVKPDIASEIAVIAADYLWKNKTVADKEINASACCLEIMNILETEIKF